MFWQLWPIWIGQRRQLRDGLRCWKIKNCYCRWYYSMRLLISILRQNRRCRLQDEKCMQTNWDPHWRRAAAERETNLKTDRDLSCNETWHHTAAYRRERVAEPIAFPCVDLYWRVVDALGSTCPMHRPRTTVSLSPFIWNKCKMSFVVVRCVDWTFIYPIVVTSCRTH